MLQNCQRCGEVVDAAKKDGSLTGGPQEAVVEVWFDMWHRQYNLCYCCAESLRKCVEGFVLKMAAGLTCGGRKRDINELG